ncbi:MAG: hypothetical protein Q8Q36_01670 [bacterium]|nr:hypothetical protein [bacterium]
MGSMTICTKTGKPCDEKGCSLSYRFCEMKHVVPTDEDENKEPQKQELVLAPERRDGFP